MSRPLDDVDPRDDERADAERDAWDDVKGEREDCRRCGGSGGGPDVALRCIACGGRGRR